MFVLLFWILATANLAHHRKRALVFLDLLPAAADFAERIRRENIDDFFAQASFAALYLGLKLLTLDQQPIEDLRLGHVRHLLALHIDNPPAIAGENRDVGALAFAGPVDDAAHDGDLNRRLDFLAQLFANILHEIEQIHLNAPAGRAGDQFGADARPQA